MKQDLHKKSIKLISIMLLAITVMTFNSVSAEDESSMTGQIGHKMQESSNSLQSLDFKRLLNQYTAMNICQIIFVKVLLTLFMACRIKV